MKGKITLTEIVGAFSVITLIFGVVFVKYFHGMKATEKRAYENARLFVSNHKIEVERLTCAGDSDGDGYGSCNIKTKSGEKIALKCPTGWVDVVIWGATGCKEEYTNLNLN